MGNLYVADRDNHRIQFFLVGQSNGTTIAGITGISGTNSTLLNVPRSLALDNQLNLYVVDTSNHRIQNLYVIETIFLIQSETDISYTHYSSVKGQ
jgi:hypothetical protein